MMQQMVSIIIPCLHEEKFIGKVLDALLKQTYPKESLEILVVDGMSTDGTREIVAAYVLKYPFIKLIDNPGRTAPKAMNIGIGLSRGEVIVRMDAHCSYPSNYVQVLVDELANQKADNVGAVIRTIPGNDSTIAQSIAIGMSHPAGVGNSHFRTGTDALKEVDTVPFGCYRRDVFKRIGLFDETLTRNQDDEFNARLVQNGGKICLIGYLQIDYFARETWAKAFKMFYQYGLFKPLVNMRLKAPATMRQFAPPAVVLAWVFAVMWCLLSPVYPGLFLILMGLAYVLPVILISIGLAVKNKQFALLFFLPLTFVGIHFSYGWGYLKGLWRYRILKKDQIAITESR